MRLIAENLGGERGGETVFSGIGFVLEGGQALIVTGPNGAGKSTLLQGHRRAAADGARPRAARGRRRRISVGRGGLLTISATRTR